MTDKTIRYDLLICKKCNDRWFITDGEAPPIDDYIGPEEICRHDWWSQVTFFAKDNGPGLAPDQIDFDKIINEFATLSHIPFDQARIILLSVMPPKESK